MTTTTDEVFDIEDAGGAKLCNLMDVDGMRTLTFHKPAPVTAAIIRNIKTLKIRDDDVMLCSAPKSGKLHAAANRPALILWTGVEIERKVTSTGTHWGFEITTMLLQGKAETVLTPKLMLMLANCSEESMENIPSPRVLNTHFPYRMLPEQMKQKKTKVVLMLRNPKDTVVSFYHHHKGMRSANYTGTFGNFLPLFMGGKLIYNSWFEYVLGFEEAIAAGQMPIHITYFEDLKENGLEEIKKIAKFLEVPADDKLCKAIHDKCNFNKMVTEKAYKSEIAKNVFREDFNIFRKGQIGDWKNYFTVAQSEAFDKLYEEKMKTSTLKFRFEQSCPQ